MSDLFSQISSESVLKAAWQHVRAKNAHGGLDGIQPGDLEKDIDQAIAGLARDLRDGKYVPVPYAKGAIPKFNEQNEWRHLSIPAVRDKIVQQAFIAVVEPLFEKHFLDCSYAYRRGKGSRQAIQRVEYILSNYPIQWITTLDIDNFFDTLDHDVLISRVANLVDEERVLNLAGLWLHAGIVGRRGEWDEPDEGIAQGSVVSPLFSNIYLHYLDKFAIDRGYHYIRYSDNFILLSATKDELYMAYEQTKSFIEQDLRLKLNDNPQPFKAVNNGFAFLGIYFKGAERRISTAKEAKIFRKINWVTEKNYQKNHEQFLKRLNETTEGIKRYYAFANPMKQFDLFDQQLLKRLRYLLAALCSNGVFPFSKENDLASYLKGVTFFIDRPPEKRNTLCLSLAHEVFRMANQKPPQENAPAPKLADKAAQAKRISAQRNKYIRDTAGKAEIVAGTPGLFIGKTAGRLVLRQQRQNVMEVPLTRVRNITINSDGVSLSSDIVYECAQNKIPITFYTYKGTPYATLQSPMHSMGTVSVQQIKAYETKTALEIGKKILIGKSKNQMNLIKFYLRHRKDLKPDFAAKAAHNIERMKEAVGKMKGVVFDGSYSVLRDRLFVTEAQISGYYWDCMKDLVIPELGFEKRERHQAKDLVNCMLNYGYGILYQRVWQTVSKAGLNPHISFVHAFQNDKPTLVYDLVEEYRQPLVDRAIFSILTKGKRGADLKLGTQGVLTKETRDKIVRAVLGKMAGLILFRGKRIKAEEVIELQVRSLVSHLDGNGTYHSFVWMY